MSRKAYFLCLVFLLSLTYNITFCQQTTSVPPTYWENYMSFKIGNYFEYEYNGGLYRYSRRIVGDTLVQSNGNRYFKIEYISPIPSPPSYRYERIDSIGDWYIYFVGTQQQCLLYRLNVPLGTAFFDGCGGVNPVILQDTFSLNTILGNYGPFFVRKYIVQGLAPADNYIAKKFQLYYLYSYEGGNYVNLVGAIIDSITYGSVTAITTKAENLPIKYVLSQNYPNPFNPKTFINFSIPEQAFISLKVTDVLSREIQTLYEGFIEPGERAIPFSGARLCSGVYFCILQSKKYSKTIKMVLIK